MSMASVLMTCGGLSLVAGPAEEPIGIDQAKLHCKVDGSEDDDLFSHLIQSAREFCESQTDRKCITQTWDYAVPRFPSSGDPLVLPYPPVSAITSVTYISGAGVSTVWPESSAGYTKHLPSGPQADFARVYPSYGVSYPGTRTQPQAVTVRFVCGYGSTGESVPAAIVSAMLLLVGHWYLHREAVDAEINSVTSILPVGVSALLAPYRVG